MTIFRMKYVYGNRLEAACNYRGVEFNSMGMIFYDPHRFMIWGEAQEDNSHNGWPAIGLEKCDYF